MYIQVCTNTYMCTHTLVCKNKKGDFIMQPDLITPEEIAMRWGVTLHTLGQWRWKGGGPLFVKIGRKVFYRQQDIIDFEVQMRRHNTSINKAA